MWAPTENITFSQLRLRTVIKYIPSIDTQVQQKVYFKKSNIVVFCRVNANCKDSVLRGSYLKKKVNINKDLIM